MSTYTITSIGLVLWYSCVLFTWVYVGKSLSLFGNHSPHGWWLVFLAFAASTAANFILNPLMWIVAGCSISSARKEGFTSKWQFYPPMIGILILACAIAGVMKYVPIPKNLKLTPADRMAAAAAPVGRAPEDKVELEGIMYAGTPSALVNGQVLEVGDEIFGLVVIAISQNAVTFTNKDGKEIIKRVK